MYESGGLPRLLVSWVVCHRTRSETTSSSLHSQWPANFIILLILFDNISSVPYSISFLIVCVQWIFKTILRICVYIPSSFISSEFIRVHVSQPYNRTDSTVAIISLILNFLLSFEFQIFLIWWQILKACAFLIYTSFSLLSNYAPRYLKSSTLFRYVPSLFCYYNINIYNSITHYNISIIDV